jgi:SAM-dependent methyltransferase
LELNVHAGAWEQALKAPVARGREGGPESVDLRENWPADLQLWREIERSREIEWQRHPGRTSKRLHRRAILAVRSLPVFPGRKVLELGAGSGIWTVHLASVLAGQNHLTAVAFNGDLAHKAQSRRLPNTTSILLKNFESALSNQTFDYVVASDILDDRLYPTVIDTAFRCLKPGGQFIFFAPHATSLTAVFQKVTRLFSRRDAGAGSQRGVGVQGLRAAAADWGFRDVEIEFIEVLPAPQSAVGTPIELILVKSPIARCFARSVCFRGSKPGSSPVETPPPTNLAVHHELFGAVSVVVPCHNEEANIERLVGTLLGMYGDYIREIVIVDDNSTDGTAAVGESLARSNPKVKLLKRDPPNGVGRALRDGYAAATGKYILSIDCDFVAIASELHRLFDAVAEGCDGAVGSRFSPESALVRYPFSKLICNRGYHLLVNLLLGKRVRDASNNLKLYRAEILKDLDIEENHFAANVETGLKPLLKNYRIREVPASWINRSAGMGHSSFNLLGVGPAYLRVLLRTAWRVWRGDYSGCA